MSSFGADGFNQGLLSAAGSIASSALSYKANKRLIQMQQGWQERMSNTAHQREVADLRAAGLNPILSGLGGSGASFGSASAPSVSFDNPVSSGLNTALAYRQQKNQDKTTNSQVELNSAQSWREGKQASLLGEQARNAAEEYNNIVANRYSIYSNIANQTALTQAQISNLEKQGNASIINALSNQTNSNTAKSTYDLNKQVQDIYSDKQKRYQDFGNNHPYLRNIDETLSRYFSGIGFGFSGSKRF
uniref:DNA pilot protein n=1 Tax=Dulem virus 196 TaxID=3145673 RepID=A0AAU8B6W1_9VIRU